ncbi:MAG: VRR-NUC domain-containing protein, partial [Cyclobacteriaceae bacterium]|nr:VRR-NUC domain-containing protein [Cyclobacteriaceae bacterium HetDA_MAG_MS6]
QQLEREGFTVEALHYYQPIKKYPSRERQVRILDQLNRLEEASHLAETILSDYVNASEKVFAKDFLARPNIRINRSTSARIKEGKVITIPPPNGEKVEQCALTYLIKQGFEGAHVENFLWRSLYGLFFWEELFDQSFESFHHPLQRIPGDVFNTTFYEKRKDLLIDKLRKHSRRKQFLSKIKTTYEEKQGISNPFVHWFEDQLLLIETLVSFVKPSTIGQVLLEMSKNLKDNSTGFPDLFIWNDDTYHFYEVKSPNDHLSSQQLFWLDFFKDQGVNAEILRLEYG